MPGLKAAEIDGRLEAAGIEMVYVVCVNDGAVMSAWGDDQGVGGSEFITMMGDTFGPRLSLESWGSLGLGVRVSKIGKISKILQIFGGLVLGCIKTKFCKKICV